jgi:integrase
MTANSNHVSELSHFENLLQELLMANPLQEKPYEKKLVRGAPGVHLPFLPEFYFQYLSEDQMKLEGTDLPYYAYCTKKGLRELNERLDAQRKGREILGDGVQCPGSAVLKAAGIVPSGTAPDLSTPGYQPQIPGPLISPPRFRGRNLFECVLAAQKVSPFRCVEGTDAWDIPYDAMTKFASAYKVLNSRPGGCKAEPFEALFREQNRMEHVLDCSSLVEWAIRTDIDPRFVFTNRRSYENLKTTEWLRQKARVLCEFAEYAGQVAVDDFKTTKVPECISYIRFVRNEDNGKELAESTLKKILGSVSQVFNDAAIIGLCRFNPFHFTPSGAKPQVRKKRIKPHELKLLIHLFRTAWKLDKAIALAILLACWSGLRKCEILRLRWRNIDLEMDTIDVPEGDHENNSKTAGRPVPMMATLKELLQLFPPGDPDELIFGHMVGTYDTRMTAVREAAGVAPWGKDGLRKNYSIGTQWLALPHEIRQKLLGHVKGSYVTVTFYDGIATSRWAKSFTEVTRKEIFGSNLPSCVASDFHHYTSTLSTETNTTKKGESYA